MGTDLAVATITGRLTRDPERREVGQHVVVNFSLACNPYRMKDEPMFVDCSAWGALSNIVLQFAHKGQDVTATGDLTQRTWDGKDGAKRTSLCLNVSGFRLSPKGSVGAEEPKGVADQGAMTDDLPF